jgi:hypothetical protein
VQNDLPAVIPGALATQVMSFFEAVHQLHDTVVTQLQALGEYAYAGFAPGGKPAQGQHEHILLGFEACIARRLLASVQVNSDLVTEFSK